MGRRTLVVEADGGSRGNPGPAGYGAVVRDAATGDVLVEVAESIGRATNNVAEYRGLIAGLTAAATVDPAAGVEVRMDSKLVVEQMSGRWAIKHADLRPLALQARQIFPSGQVRYTWVPRSQNKHADRLANEAMDAAADGRTWQRSTLPSPGQPGTGDEAEPEPAPDASMGRAGHAPESASTTGSTPQRWLAWIREVQSLAQAGLVYGNDAFDIERYARLRDLAAEMMAALVDAPPERLRMLFGDEVGYLTPKLDVRAAVFDEQGRVLLVRERRDGRWTLPGGWADVAESVGEGAVREVREDSGYEVVVERLLGLYERERHGHPPLPQFTLKAVVAARVVGGAAAEPGIETDGVGWFGADDVPALSEGRTSPQLLARVFAHYADPTLGTDLD